MLSDERALLRMILYTRTEAEEQGYDNAAVCLESAAVMVWERLKDNPPSAEAEDVTEEMSKLLAEKAKTRLSRRL